MTLNASRHDGLLTAGKVASDPPTKGLGRAKIIEGEMLRVTREDSAATALGGNAAGSARQAGCVG